MLTESQKLTTEQLEIKQKFMLPGVPEEIAEFMARTLPMDGGDTWMSPEQRYKVEQLQLKALEQQKQ